MSDIFDYLLNPTDPPRRCVHGTPGCITEHTTEDHDLAGVFCDAPMGAVETHRHNEPITVSAGRWTDTTEIRPWVMVDAGPEREMSPNAARHLAAALLAGADRAEIAA